MHTHSAFLVRQAAGNAVAYGMDKIAALKAMTLNPASVFGFADKAGSLEPGKQANSGYMGWRPPGNHDFGRAGDSEW